MRWYARGVTAVVTTVLAGIWLPQPAQAEYLEQAPETAALELAIRPSKAAVATGDPIELAASVTNHGAQACRLAAMADGTIEVTSVTRDGRPVSPEFFQAMYTVGLPAQWAETARKVSPGKRVSFPLAQRSALSAVSPLPSGNGVGAQWSLRKPGKYVVTAVYRAPYFEESCAGASQEATARFAVTSPTARTSPGWTLTGALAGLGAVLIGLAAVLIWRRRGSGRHRGGAPDPGRGDGQATSAFLVLALLAATAVTGTWRPPPAAAAAFTAAGDCIARFTPGDPQRDPAGIMGFINVFPVQIIEKKGYGGTNASKDHADIYWDPTKSDAYRWEKGVTRDPCSALYHEFVHVYDIANGEDVESGCEGARVRGSKPTPIGDVRATRAENALRRVLGKGSGKNPRAFHGPGEPLPAHKPGGKRGNDWDWEQVRRDCEEKEKKKRKGPQRAREAGGGSDGDPHMTTFDQRRYDFQAVGEFLLAKSGDVEVHARQAAFQESRLVSVNTALGLRVGGDTLSFALHGNGRMQIVLNGEQTIFGDEATALPGGGEVTRNGYEHTVVWPDGTEADVFPIGSWGLRILLYPAKRHEGKFTGLLGDFDSDPDNDLVGADGRPLPAEPSHKQLYGGFADHWRISQADSLLPYPTGKNTASYTDKTFPDKFVSHADLDARARKAASRICEMLGIIERARVRDCVLDVALTGQPAFATTAVTTEQLLSDTAQGVAPGPAPENPPPSKRVKPGGALGDGDSADATIGAAGEEHTYRLELGDATVVRLHDVVGERGASGGGSLKVELDGPSGEGSPGFTVTSNYQYRVKRGGAYTLKVSRSGNDTGKYGFRLVTAKERRISAKIGDSVTGRLDVPGRVDLLEIRADRAGEVHLTDGAGCELSVAMADDVPDPRVYTPSSPCWDLSLAKVEPGKRYLLIVWSPEGRTGDYSFRIASR